MDSDQTDAYPLGPVEDIKKVIEELTYSLVPTPALTDAKTLALLDLLRIINKERAKSFKEGEKYGRGSELSREIIAGRGHLPNNYH